MGGSTGGTPTNAKQYKHRKGGKANVFLLQILNTSINMFGVLFHFLMHHGQWWNYLKDLGDSCSLLKVHCSNLSFCRTTPPLAISETAIRCAHSRTTRTLAQAVHNQRSHTATQIFCYSHNIFRGNKVINLQVIWNIWKERHLSKLHTYVCVRGKWG